MVFALESGSIEFGLKIDHLLSSDSQNMVFSPFSLSTALVMTLLGAHNKSGEELSNALFGKIIGSNEYQSLAEEYEILVQQCLKANSNVLSYANFLYSHINYPILQNYKQMIESSLSAKSQELDFCADNKRAIETINRDISIATNGKIPKFLKEIGIDTNLVLVNAIYFKGLWTTTFNKHLTKLRKFTTNDKNKIRVEMMYQKANLPFAISKSLNCRAIQLSYSYSSVVMIVLLPDENSSVSELKEKLNFHTINELLNGMNRLEVEVYLPKFRIESTIPLVPVLKNYGIKHIFDRNSANFSGITNDPFGLYVNVVIQKAIIEVNEEGTEAAAATRVEMRSKGRSTKAYIPPELFKVNRPFMFLLVSHSDSDKNVLLFTGTVNNPKALT